MNLITSAGAAAEQTVPHLHLHVVPRWSDDGFGEIWAPKKPLAHSLEKDAAERIRAACVS
jgi:histidine triad (HIT) family protein